MPGPNSSSSALSARTRTVGRTRSQRCGAADAPELPRALRTARPGPTRTPQAPLRRRGSGVPAGRGPGPQGRGYFPKRLLGGRSPLGQLMPQPTRPAPAGPAARVYLQAAPPPHNAPRCRVELPRVTVASHPGAVPRRHHRNAAAGLWGGACTGLASPTERKGRSRGGSR